MQPSRGNAEVSRAPRRCGGEEGCSPRRRTSCGCCCEFIRPLPPGASAIPSSPREMPRQVRLRRLGPRTSVRTSAARPSPLPLVTPREANLPPAARSPAPAPARRAGGRARAAARVRGRDAAGVRRPRGRDPLGRRPQRGAAVRGQLRHRLVVGLPRGRLHLPGPQADDRRGRGALRPDGVERDAPRLLGRLAELRSPGKPDRQRPPGPARLPGRPRARAGHLHPLQRAWR
jgi:hypothetical protein